MRTLLLLMLCLVLSACGARREPASPEPPRPHVEEGAAVITQTAPMPVSKQLEGQTGVTVLIMTDTGFEPKQIHAKTGSRVKLHVLNKGTKEHNLVIPRFQIGTQNMASGSENYVEFTANAQGEWPFFSDAPGTKEEGFLGSLKVE